MIIYKYDDDDDDEMQEHKNAKDKHKTTAQISSIDKRFSAEQIT